MSIKQELLQVCLDHVNKRIYNYKQEIETIKESIESNDKSTDEDDDSGHGKLLNDLEKNMIHLADANKMLDMLSLINPKLKNDKAVLGSLISTQSTAFFLSVSVGKIDLEHGTYFAISLQSPIGALLKNKEVGEHINFNGTDYTINSII
ncbi:transcription elongation factor [Geojedonia litorea]|uniref:Transcription elongation factor n=1 Tax=Geojedonia litorea TaxID=1268269 RepID=A0ABV9N6N7_9FLAO